MIKPEIREKIIKMLTEGKIYNEISEECDCSIKTIQRVAKDNNIKPKTGGKIQSNNNSDYITREELNSIKELLLDKIEALELTVDNLKVSNAKINNLEFDKKYHLKMSDGKEIDFDDPEDVWGVLDIKITESFIENNIQNNELKIGINGAVISKNSCYNVIGSTNTYNDSINEFKNQIDILHNKINEID